MVDMCNFVFCYVYIQNIELEYIFVGLRQYIKKR